MIQLGPITSEAARALLIKLRNRPEIIAPLGANFRYMAENHIERTAEQWAVQNETSERCFIYRDQTVIGFTSLTSIDHLNGCAEFSIQLIETEQGKGFGSAATKLMVDHGFSNLNLNKIYLHVLEDNFAAVKCYMSCGFKTEGTLRQSIFKNGSYKNQRVMSILAEEFEWTEE